MAEAAAHKASFRALPLPAPGQDIKPLGSLMGPIGQQGHHGMGPMRKHTPIKAPSTTGQHDACNNEEGEEEEEEDGGLFLLTGIGEETAAAAGGAAAAPVPLIDVIPEDGVTTAGPRTMELTAHGYGTGNGGADDDSLPLMLRMVRQFPPHLCLP